MQPLNVKTPPLGAVASGETAIQGELNREQVTPHGAMALHPLCLLFPRMLEPEFEALKADIKINGLHQPIVVHGGQVLDGGNRYRACLELGIEPPTVQYAGDDPIGFVMSANMHRRHLTPGQQAVIVASAQDWELAQARGGDGSNQYRSKPATLPICSNQAVRGLLETVADRATQSGASARTQRMADKVARADSDLARQVAHGEISLPKAVARIEQKPAPAKEPKPEPETDPHADLITEAERLLAENRALQERVDALTKDDLAAELDKRVKLYHQLEGRLNQALTTSNEAQREATRKGKVLAQIRVFLKVERDAEILAKLKGGV